ncbi:MAG: Crp/Fnr family transcriptional regulator [Bacteroidota bacterium]
MNSFLSLLIQHLPIGEVQADLLLQRSVKRVKKGTVLQRQGEKATIGFFVREGLLRAYTLDDKGKEHIFIFAPEGWMAGDVESFTYEAPAELFVDALEDSIVEVITPELMEQIDPSQAFLREQNQRLLRRVGVLQRRVLMLMSAPAIERYEHFLETYPQIIDRVPQKMIASYLGITPEALSTLKKKAGLNPH